MTVIKEKEKEALKGEQEKDGKRSQASSVWSQPLDGKRKLPLLVLLGD
jgi:hypothetical protein